MSVDPRPLIVSLFFLCICIPSTAQIGGEWMWVSGSSTVNSPANYGPKGVPSAQYIPGARSSHSGIVNAGGNFWMFGGEDVNENLYNDLWLYNPSNVTWEWVSGDNTVNNRGVYGTKGTFAATNKPGARMGQSIAEDNSGYVWLFGGYGEDGSGNLGYLNDLWKFDPYTSQWAWISGANTANSQPIYKTLLVTLTNEVPGSRYYPSIAADASGNIWVFGGYGYDVNGNVGAMGDTWKYDPAYSGWVWESGASTRNAAGTYHSQGQSGVPGARYQQSMVFDGSGDLWLFGGTDGSNHYFNDLWKTTTPSEGDNWIWVGGENTTNNGGTYGTKTVTATTNMPGGRSAAALMSDGAGNFWLFGGYGFDVNQDPGELNDLWQYSSATSEWTWAGGDNIRNQSAVYGGEGFPAPTNTPSGRAAQPGFIDVSGNVYIMGGATPPADNNDLWEFTPAYYVLALKTVSLQGTPNSSGNVLTWQTQDEIDTKSFVVEKSPDGAVFANIGSVPAVGSGSNTYSFTDTHPTPGNAFYRLQIIDDNNNVGYSSIIALTNTSAGPTLNVYPNPTKAGITVSIGNDALLNTPLKLFDISGRLLSEELITNRQQYLNLQQFPAGIYLLQLSNGVTTRITKD
jgi:N-acetylneuraminic acid mutarotase